MLQPINIEFKSMHLYIINIILYFFFCIHKYFKQRLFGRQVSSALHISGVLLERDANKKWKILWNINYECIKLNSIFIGCNIWIINLKFNWIICYLTKIVQLREFVCVLRSSVWVVFNPFLFIYATYKSWIRNLYPLLLGSYDSLKFAILA